MARVIDWYFDYISPFAYIQLEAGLARLPADVELRYRPVLLGALLSHWETKGPAEVPAHRQFTYRLVQWLSEQHQLKMCMPPAHPFNPLPALRLTLALDSRPEVVLAIFRHLWREGRSASQLEELREVAAQFGIAHEQLDSTVNSEAVKQALRDNTQQAIAAGVFGVPTAVIDGELFWGFDSTGMLLDYLSNPELFKQGEMARVSDLPVGLQRRT